MEEARKTKRRAALGFLIFSLLTVGAIFILRWQPRADFDVTGILWLMQNVVRLIVLSIFIALATGAGITWLRSGRREPKH